MHKKCTKSYFLVFSANGKITVKSSVIEKPVANHTYLKFIEKYTPFFNQLSICKSVYNHASKMQKGTEGRKVYKQIFAMLIQQVISIFPFCNFTCKNWAYTYQKELLPIWYSLLQGSKFWILRMDSYVHSFYIRMIMLSHLTQIKSCFYRIYLCTLQKCNNLL